MYKNKIISGIQKWSVLGAIFIFVVGVVWTLIESNPYPVIISLAIAAIIGEVSMLITAVMAD